MSDREVRRHCCVCGEALVEDARRLGGRTFCARHHVEAIRAAHRPWWRGAVSEIGAVAAFVVLVPILAGSGPVATSLPYALAFVLPPAALLLIWVWRQDRIEPEPPAIVFLVFMAGVLLNEGFVVPMARDVFRLSEWQHLSQTSGWVGAFLVEAMLRQASVYAAVRYTVYLTDEFDEPADGVVYAGAAGLGLATAQNFHFVMEAEHVLPREGSVYVATTCLITLAGAAAIGLGLARRRLRPHPKEIWIATAFVVAVVLDGGLTQLTELAGIDGGDFDPWVSMCVATGSAAVLLIAVDFLMSRLSLEAFITHADEGETQ